MSKSIDINNLVERDGLYYEKFTNKPFTGNSTGLKQGKIKDGKQEGEWLVYYKNGQLNSKRNYKDGKMEGERLKYNENGQLSFKGNYKDGKQEGKQLWYDDKGQLKSTQIYKDGEPIEIIQRIDGIESKELRHYANGELRQIEQFKDGEKDGKQLYYNDKGRLEQTKIYKDGELIETIKHLYWFEDNIPITTFSSISILCRALAISVISVHNLL